MRHSQNVDKLEADAWYKQVSDRKQFSAIRTKPHFKKLH